MRLLEGGLDDFLFRQLAARQVGDDGVDQDVIGRLAERVAVSRAQQASVTRDAVTTVPAGRLKPAAVAPSTGVSERAGASGEAVFESRVGRVLREQRERERARGRDHGIE